MLEITDIFKSNIKFFVEYEEMYSMTYYQYK